MEYSVKLENNFEGRASRNCPDIYSTKDVLISWRPIGQNEGKALRYLTLRRPGC